MTVTQQTPTAWPEGVIARYLTVGTATVDITETGPRDANLLYATVATCTGCGEDDDFHWEDGFYDYGDQFQPLERQEAIARAEFRARNWAQKHAEDCRAMPKPDNPV